MASNRLLTSLRAEASSPVAAMKVLQQLQSRSSRLQFNSSSSEYSQAIKVCFLSKCFRSQFLVETIESGNYSRCQAPTRFDLDASLLSDHPDDSTVLDSINDKVGCCYDF